MNLLKTWRLSHQKNKQTFQNFPANSEARDPHRVTHGAHVKAAVLLSEFRHSTDLHQRSLNTVLANDSLRRQMLLATTSPLTGLLDQAVHLDKRKMISKPPSILCFRSDYSHLSSTSSKYSLNVFLSCPLNF